MLKHSRRMIAVGAVVLTASLIGGLSLTAAPAGATPPLLGQPGFMAC